MCVGGGGLFPHCFQVPRWISAAAWASVMNSRETTIHFELKKKQKKKNPVWPHGKLIKVYKCALAWVKATAWKYKFSHSFSFPQRAGMKLTPVKICRKLCIGNISLHYLNTFQCANSISLNLGQEFYFIFLISTFELPLCWFLGPRSDHLWKSVWTVISKCYQCFNKPHPWNLKPAN